MRAVLEGSAEPLLTRHDTVLVDLDGVVYVGPHAVEGAVEALASARSAGVRVAFVTNNASRTPDTVARHLCDLGVPASADDVVTAAQAAARLVADRVPAGSAVLVVGGEGLEVALADVGLRPVRSADEGPAAVVQGFSPDVGWRELTEGTLAVARGVPWVASNADPTLPTGRGLAPGNGALVGVIRSATGAAPVVAGKPELPLHQEAVRRTQAKTPLVVGDRLDTDIDGANRAEVASLLVLTGVSGPVELLAAEARLRPTYLAEDLGTGLLEPHPPVDRRGGRWCCRGWSAWREGTALRLEGAGERLDALRALCAAAWDAPRDTEVDPTDALAHLGW